MEHKKDTDWFYKGNFTEEFFPPQHYFLQKHDRFPFVLAQFFNNLDQDTFLKEILSSKYKLLHVREMIGKEDCSIIEPGPAFFGEYFLLNEGGYKSHDLLGHFNGLTTVKALSRGQVTYRQQVNFYVLEIDNILILISLMVSETQKNTTITFLYLKEDTQQTYSLLEHFQKYILKPNQTKENKIHFITQNSAGGFYLSEQIIDYTPGPINLNYGNNFLPVDEKINNLLNENKSGLILFHGEPGCGKSSYIKGLCQTFSQKDKKVIYLPPNLLSVLSNPSFSQFVFNECKNSIFIIEDAEEVLRSREQNYNQTAVSTLLNLTDGILGDILKTKFVLTFNCEKEKIDPALIRKGRLDLIHKFDKLNSKEADTLLIHLGKKPQGKDMTLADIYNLEIDNNNRELKAEARQIGFASMIQN